MTQYIRDDSTGQSHIVYDTYRDDTIHETRCGGYLVVDDTSRRVLTGSPMQNRGPGHRPVADVDGLKICAFCVEMNLVDVSEIRSTTLPGTPAGAMMRYHDALDENIILDELELSIIRDFNRLMHVLPENVAQLIRMRLIFEREFADGRRCSVCGRRGDESCATKC